LKHFLRDTFSISLQGQGLYRNGISAFAYFPLSITGASETEAIISSLEEEYRTLEKEGKLAPGLKAQLDTQIKILKDTSIPDCEIASFPGMFSPVGKSTFFGHGQR